MLPITFTSAPAVIVTELIEDSNKFVDKLTKVLASAITLLTVEFNCCPTTSIVNAISTATELTVDCNKFVDTLTSGPIVIATLLVVDNNKFVLKFTIASASIEALPKVLASATTLLTVEFNCCPVTNSSNLISTDTLFNVVVKRFVIVVTFASATIFTVLTVDSNKFVLTSIATSKLSSTLP
jgi:hypothetical protein